MTFDGRRTARTRQVGTVVGTPSSGLLAITFPATLADVPVVVACPGDDANGLASAIVKPTTVTAAGFTVRCITSAGGNISGAPVRINYIAEVP